MQLRRERNWHGDAASLTLNGTLNRKMKAAMQSATPYLFIIKAGPVWNVDDLEFAARTFGREFDGEIITWAARKQELRSGRFSASTVPWNLDRPRLSRIVYVLRVVLRGLSIRWLKRRRLVVISYDPLQSGFIALLLKRLAGARFICEVNGVYWHPDTFIDFDDRVAAEAKRTRMVRMASSILAHADVIKLLYPGQLEGFDLPDPPPPSVSFPDIVDSSRFVPRGTAPQRRVIFIGYPFLLKGVDLLLDAFERVADEFPDWRLTLVGFELEAPARARGFREDRVEILGPQSAPVIRDLIEASSILVLPSRSEGMGRVLLEAALLGRARIGSRAGGIPSVIDDGVDGLLFDTGDAADLARALRRVMSSPELCAQLGHNARERALREFTEDRYIAHYRDVIASLIHPSGTGVAGPQPVRIRA